MRGWTIVCLGLVAACGGAMAPQHSVAFPEFHRKLTNGITLVIVPRTRPARRAWHTWSST